MPLIYELIGILILFVLFIPIAFGILAFLFRTGMKNIL